MHTTTLHNKDLVVTGYLTKILWLTLSPVVRLSHTGVIDLHTNLSQVWLIKVSCSWLLHGLMSVKEYITQEHCKRQEFIYYCPLIQFNRLCTSLCYLEWKYKQVQSPSKRGLKDISSQTRNSTATSFVFLLMNHIFLPEGNMKMTVLELQGATVTLVTCSKINFSLIIIVYMHNWILLQLVCTFSRIHTLIFSVSLYTV